MDKLATESDQIRRRDRVELDTPAESAIRAAMERVKSAGSDPMLLEAIELLKKAKARVSDYVDSRTAFTKLVDDVKLINKYLDPLMTYKSNARLTASDLTTIRSLLELMCQQMEADEARVLNQPVLKSMIPMIVWHHSGDRKVTLVGGGERLVTALNFCFMQLGFEVIPEQNINRIKDMTFHAMVAPVVEWLQARGHPHQYVMISQTSASLLEDSQTIPFQPPN